MKKLAIWIFKHPKVGECTWKESKGASVAEGVKMVAIVGNEDRGNGLPHNLEHSFTSN